MAPPGGPTMSERGRPDSEKDAERSSGNAPEDEFYREPLEIPTGRFWFLGIGLALGLFLSFIDSSIVATSLFSIGNDFHDLAQVNWVALAYTLAYLSCAVLFARISDVTGRRDAFLVAYLCFVAFSMGCGFAQTLNQLIACRALQGIGGSGLYSITMIVFTEASPPRLRQFISSVVAIVIAVAGALGPVLGGILTQYTTWRWVFWINGPIGLVSMILFYFAWPKPEYLPALERRKWKDLDYLGSILLVAASVLVCFAFQSAGGNADTWGQASFLAPLVVGVACLVGLIGWAAFADSRWGDDIAATLPMKLMRNRIYFATVINTMFLGFPYILLLYALPLRLQVVNGQSSLLAGLMLLPMLGSSAMGSILAGIINSKTDRLSETLFVANAFMVLGCGLLCTLAPTEAIEAKALGFLVFPGLGFGLSAASSTMYANLQSSVRDHAPAQGVLAQVRILGGSIGIAASSAILGLALRTQLAGIVDLRQLSSLESTRGSLSPDQLNAIRYAYADAFSQDMRVSTIVAGVALLACFATWTDPNARLTHADRHRMQVQEEAERIAKQRASTES